MKLKSLIQKIFGRNSFEYKPNEINAQQQLYDLMNNPESVEYYVNRLAATFIHHYDVDDFKAIDCLRSYSLKELKTIYKGYVAIQENGRDPFEVDLFLYDINQNN